MYMYVHVCVQWLYCDHNGLLASKGLLISTVVAKVVKITVYVLFYTVVMY